MFKKINLKMARFSSNFLSGEVREDDIRGAREDDEHGWLNYYLGSIWYRAT